MSCYDWNSDGRWACFVTQCMLDNFACLIIVRLVISPTLAIVGTGHQSWGRLHANVIDYNYNYFEIS